MKFLAFIGLMFAGLVMADPQVPNEPPVSATAIMLCHDHGTQLVATIVTFADGTVLRIDVEQMHGFTTPEEILAYAETAKNKYGYRIKCKGETST